MINKEIRNWYKGKITVKAVDGTYDPEITEFDYTNEDLYSGNGLYIGTFHLSKDAIGIQDVIGAQVSFNYRSGWAQLYIKEPFSDVYFTVYSYRAEEE